MEGGTKIGSLAFLRAEVFEPTASVTAEQSHCQYFARMDGSNPPEFLHLLSTHICN